MKRTIVAAALGIVALAGCDSYNNARGIGDAPIGKVADQAWDIENAPDGFGNVATKCSAYIPGARLWVVTHGKTDVQPVITTDENCKGGK